MQLTYRGTTYDYTPARPVRRPFQLVRRAGAPYTLRYRGLSYQIDPNAPQTQTSTEPIVYSLIYRGVTYLVKRNR